MLGPRDYFDSAIEYAKVKPETVVEFLDPNGHDPYVANVKLDGEPHTISRVSVDFTEPNHAANDNQVRPVVYLFDESVTEDNMGQPCKGVIIGLERKGGSYVGGSKYYIPDGKHIANYKIKYADYDPLKYADSLDTYLPSFQLVNRPEGMNSLDYFDTLVEKEREDRSKLLAPKISW